MNEKTKHVLLRQDLSPAFDEEWVLEEIDKMDKEGGGWRDHIPYAAARQYRSDPEICDRYKIHVDDCSYCQRMIEALNPLEEVVRDFHKIRSELGSKENFPDVQEMDSEDQVWPLVLTSYRRLIDEYSVNVSLLSELEKSEDMESKFKSARIYLSTAQPHLAYEQISKGFVLADVDARVVDCMTSVAESWEETKKMLQDAVQEADKLLESTSLDDENNQLQLVKSFAQLGRHDIAMNSLHTMLIHLGNDVAVKALEEAHLVGARAFGIYGKPSMWGVQSKEEMARNPKTGLSHPLHEGELT